MTARVSLWAAPCFGILLFFAPSIYADIIQSQTKVEWSTPYNGLRIKLELPKASYAKGDSLPFILKMQNISTESVFVSVNEYKECLKALFRDGEELLSDNLSFDAPPLKITIGPNDTYQHSLSVLGKDNLLSEGSYWVNFSCPTNVGQDLDRIRIKSPSLRLKIKIRKR